MRTPSAPHAAGVAILVFAGGWGAGGFVVVGGLCLWWQSEGTTHLPSTSIQPQSILSERLPPICRRIRFVLYTILHNSSDHNYHLNNADKKTSPTAQSQTGRQGENRKKRLPNRTIAGEYLSENIEYGNLNCSTLTRPGIRTCGAKPNTCKQPKNKAIRKARQQSSCNMHSNISSLGGSKNFRNDREQRTYQKDEWKRENRNNF